MKDSYLENLQRQHQSVKLQIDSLSKWESVDLLNQMTIEGVYRELTEQRERIERVSNSVRGTKARFRHSPTMRAHCGGLITGSYYDPDTW